MGKKWTLHYFLSKLGTRALLLPWRLLTPLLDTRQENSTRSPRSPFQWINQSVGWIEGSKIVGFVCCNVMEEEKRRSFTSEKEKEEREKGAWWSHRDGGFLFLFWNFVSMVLFFEWMNVSRKSKEKSCLSDFISILFLSDVAARFRNGCFEQIFSCDSNLCLCFYRVFDGCRHLFTCSCLISSCSQVTHYLSFVTVKKFLITIGLPIFTAWTCQHLSGAHESDEVRYSILCQWKVKILLVSFWLG